MEKSREKTKVKFIYSESDSPCFYVQGARGGPIANYDFRIDFYSNKLRNPDVEIISEDGETDSLFTKTDESYDKYTVVDRKIEVSVILSFTAAKELATWLSKRLTEHENQMQELEGKPQD
jgi:hypothetical protein